jgi:hypothetical protein
MTAFPKPIEQAEVGKLVNHNGLLCQARVTL